MFIYQGLWELLGQLKIFSGLVAGLKRDEHDKDA
jgi:hypothetical protein